MRKSSFMFCLKFCHLVLFAHAYRLKTNPIFNEFHTSIFQIVQFLTCKIFRCVNFKCVCSPILLIGSFGAPGFSFKTLKWPDNVEEAGILLSIVFFGNFSFCFSDWIFTVWKLRSIFLKKTWQLGGKINFPSLILFVNIFSKNLSNLWTNFNVNFFGICLIRIKFYCLSCRIFALKYYFVENWLLYFWFLYVAVMLWIDYIFQFVYQDRF